MDLKQKDHLKRIGIAGGIIFLGLIVFKLIPMKIWGEKILFDASGHISISIFVLYILWFFIDQNKSWRIPYLFLAALVLTIIALQRILDNAHNDVGLLLGLLLGLSAIALAEKEHIKGKINF